MQISFDKSRVIIGMAASVLMSACQYHSFAPPPNQAPQDVQVAQSQAQAAPTLQVMDAKSGPVLQPPEYYQQILATQGVTYDQIQKQVQGPLAAYILDPHTLASPSITSSNDFYLYQRIFDQAMINMADLGADRTETADAYRLFEANVLAPCLESRNQCAALKLMSKDSRFSAVTMNTNRILQLDSEKAWQYSFFAQDFSSSPLSDDFQNQFFGNLVTYLQKVATGDNKDNRGKVADAAQKLNQLVVSNGTSSAGMQNFLDRVDIWSEDGKEAKLQIDPKVRRALRDAIWSNLIAHQTFSSSGQPTASFARWINAQLEVFGSTVIDQFTQDDMVKRIWTSYQLSDPRISTKAQATDADQQRARAITFIFDQTFLGKIQRADALTLLGQMNASQEEIVNISQSYVRVRFSAMMLQTQRGLKILLGDPEHYKNIHELTESLDAAQKMEVQWAAFLSEFNSLRDIVETTAATRQADMTPALLDKMTTTFGQMDRDIKWFVTYPNMLPVLYYVSKANLADQLQVLWFTIDLNSDMIFKMLINGTLGVWFNFTGSMQDDSPFSAPEVVYAFRNALNSEVFTTFGIQPSSFLLEASDRLLTQTSVILDNASASLYRKLYVGVEYEGLDRTDTNAFMQATDFCQGKPVTETLALERLQYGIVGPEEAMINSLSQVRIFSMAVAGNTSDEDDEDLDNLNDKMRTDNFYSLELVEKMVSIYKDYLAHYHLTDENMQLVDQKLEQIHQKMRKYFGLQYMGANRYTQCMFYVGDLGNKREFQALKYEKMYLQQAYRDLQALDKDHSLLDSLNAKYTHDFSALRLTSKDRFQISGNNVAFIYNKFDFTMRLKDYLQKGAVDPATQQQFPAIAPGVIITTPDNPKTAGGFFWKSVNSGAQGMAVPLEPGDDEAKFLSKAMTAFFDSPGYLTYNVTRNIDPFATWFGTMTAMGVNLSLNSGREKFEGVLMKMGEVDAYDFEKEGCDPRQTFTDLDKTCLTKMSISPDRAFDENKRVLDLINPTPEQVDLLTLTHNDTMVGDHHLWLNVFFSNVDQSPIGLLDPYLYLSSSQLLGGNLLWPGQASGDSSGGPLPRKGNLDHAKAYYLAFGSQDPNFLTTPAELDGHVRDLFNGLVRREFDLSYALEAKAAEKADQGPYSVRIEVSAPAYKIPISTGVFAQPAKTREQLFDSATDFTFAKAK